MILLLLFELAQDALWLFRHVLYPIYLYSEGDFAFCCALAIKPNISKPFLQEPLFELVSRLPLQRRPFFTKSLYYFFTFLINPVPATFE